MLFQDKQSISTSSKRNARERSSFSTCTDDRDVTHLEIHTITHTCRKEQQLIREHAVWVEGGKFTINVRPSDVRMTLTFWTREKV